MADVLLDVLVAMSSVARTRDDERGIDVLRRCRRRFGAVIMRVACSDCHYRCLELRSLECLRRAFVVNYYCCRCYCQGALFCRC